MNTRLSLVVIYSSRGTVPLTSHTNIGINKTCFSIISRFLDEFEKEKLKFHNLVRALIQRITVLST
jgi:hypothetical protein